MGKKNPGLCEKPHCRESWAFLVSGDEKRFGGKHWRLRVCGSHAEPYQGERDSVRLGSDFTITPRRFEKCP